VKSIERLWLLSGSATADLLLDRALAAANANNQDLAMKLLDAAVLLQPDFAEAWNRRAYLYFMKSDYKRALGDLRRVLALEPNHFHALEGLAQILRSIGEKKAALDAYKKLLAVNPQAAGAKEAVDELTLEVDGQGI
jgi:tetratricopeptide (TPR) repeat protein